LDSKSSNSADVFVPRTKTKMGDRAFEVAGPVVHVLGTVFLQLFGKLKPFLLSKNS